jgi:hypothetical protein
MCPAKLYKPHPVVADASVAPGKSIPPVLRGDLSTRKPSSDAIAAISVNFFTKRHRNASSIQNEHWRKVSSRLEARITLLLNWKHR